MMNNAVFTIGHSTHTFEQFSHLLKTHHITALCDVRSSPYSRFNPQFNREALQISLKPHGIKYVFLGQELGARSEDLSCYIDGRVQYDALAKTELFQSGLDRIITGLQRGYRTALMCAEKCPLECHRTILVARNLYRKEVQISHILSDGSLETYEYATDRLVNRFNLEHDDFFLSTNELEEKAYRKQEEVIAYVRR